MSMHNLRHSIAKIHGEIQELVGHKANEHLYTISDLYEKSITELQADNARLAECESEFYKLRKKLSFIELYLYDKVDFPYESSLSPHNLEKLLAKRDLLMKVEGVRGVLSNCEVRWSGDIGDEVVITNDILYHAYELTKQAEEL